MKRPISTYRKSAKYKTAGKDFREGRISLSQYELAFYAEQLRVLELVSKQITHLKLRKPRAKKA